MPPPLSVWIFNNAEEIGIYSFSENTFIAGKWLYVRMYGFTNIVKCLLVLCFIHDVTKQRC